MTDKSVYAAPAESDIRQPEESDDFLAQYGFDPQKEKVRWPHLVGASFLGLNAVYTFILIIMGENKLVIWPIVDLTLAIGALLIKKKLYANFAAIRGGTMVLLGAPILFFAVNPVEAIVTFVFGISLVCLCWGQPNAVRAWIGTALGGLYLGLFTLGLVVAMFVFPNR